MSRCSTFIRSLFWLFISTMMACLLIACVQEVELEIPERGVSRLIIRGRLIKREVPFISVQISKLAESNQTVISEAVSGASVVLIDEAGNGLDIPEEEAGVYERPLITGTAGLEIVSGGAYRLSVSTPQSQNYISEVEKLLPVSEPLQINQSFFSREILNDFDKLEDQTFVRFFLTTPTSGGEENGPSYFKWDLLGTYQFPETVSSGEGPADAQLCYIDEFLNRATPTVFSSHDARAELIENFPIWEEPFDFRFAHGFYLSVFQQSLSEGAYRYWSRIGEVIQNSGNFFDTPAGKIKGNFRNVDDETEEVFGYFYATEEKVIRYFVDLGPQAPASLCPRVTAGEQRVDTTCTNCLLRAGSTLIKPEFWEE